MISTEYGLIQINNRVNLALIMIWDYWINGLSQNMGFYQSTIIQVLIQAWLVVLSFQMVLLGLQAWVDNQLYVALILAFIQML